MCKINQPAPIGDVNLIPAIVALMNIEALHVVGEVVDGIGVD
jgi:hypothetical protein